MDWLRWWHGSLTDPKFQWVARKSKQEFSRVVTLWVALLEYASSVTQCNADVTRGSLQNFDVTDFDVLLNVDDGVCQSIYAAFEEKGLIKDGRIANWDKRQPKREDDSSNRVAEHRARKKLEESQVKLDALMTELEHAKAECNALKRDVTLGNAREDKSREDKKEKEQKTFCAEPQSDSTQAVMNIPLNSGEDFPITQTQADEWSSAYPAVDVIRQLAAMRQWCLAHPAKRKTKRGVLAFCNSWLMRAQDNPQVPQARASPSYQNKQDRDKAFIDALTGASHEQRTPPTDFIDIN